jgi:hypothetical protein
MGAGVSRPAPTPNEQNLCDCCFYPFDGSKVWHNGGFAHARCAAEHERLILGDDAMPGREAAALGIDRQQIVRAIERVRG